MSTDAIRAALVKLYAAVVRAHVTGTSIRYDHYAMVEARAALAQTVSAERVPLTDEQRKRITDRVIGPPFLTVDQVIDEVERAHGIGEPK